MTTRFSYHIKQPKSTKISNTSTHRWHSWTIPFNSPLKIVVHIHEILNLYYKNEYFRQTQIARSHKTQEFKKLAITFNYLSAGYLQEKPRNPHNNSGQLNLI